MPERPLTIATYAAGASLAAITLVYVFGPTYFIDGEAAESSASTRKRGVVGLHNPANDCFINSVLQAFAGLGDLRQYLIREIHRRELDGEGVYENLIKNPAHPDHPAWKIEGLQRGVATRGLKNMLDALNERPLYKKTISASAFVKVLEEAFRQRLSRNQQDAQEFLQVVAERLSDEYHAGSRARKRARELSAAQKMLPNGENFKQEDLDRELHRLAADEEVEGSTAASQPPVDPRSPQPPVSNGSPSSSVEIVEEGFPMEGKSESQIECLTCGFKPKPSQSTFCTLTLNVPQVSSTSLSACFDGMLKTEYIEDFKCEKCRLIHAVEIFEAEMRTSEAEDRRSALQEAIDGLREATEKDPEAPPKEIQLPDSKFAPKRKIARHVRITEFPKILAIHLSRSIFDIGKSSMKNSAKIQFPESLPLGGLTDRKNYKLLAMVTHKGSHHSGHYESFRRQNVYPPFSNPNTLDKTGVYSKTATPSISMAPTPQLNAFRPVEDASTPSSPELLSPESPSASSRLSLASSHATPVNGSSDALSSLPNGISQPRGPTSNPRDSDTHSLKSLTDKARSTLSKVPSNISNTFSRSNTNLLDVHASPSSTPSPTNMTHTRSSVALGSPAAAAKPQRRKKAPSDRWWRISDDQIKESRTRQVLGMQKEVYLLFYELDRSGEDSLN